MTTIVYTPGMFAADSCFTEEVGEDSAPLNRTYGRKLKFQRFFGRRPERGTVLAIASRGDSDAGEELDTLVLEQATRALKAGSCGLLDPLNAPKLLKERTDIVKDTGTDAILVWFHGSGETAYRINGRGRLALLDGPYFATGHDAGVAYGALGMGANAVQAVELAAKHGVCTSKPIHYLQRVDGDVKFEELK